MQIKRITSSTNTFKYSIISYWTDHIALEMGVLPLLWLYFFDKTMIFGCFILHCSNRCHMFLIDIVRRKPLKEISLMSFQMCSSAPISLSTIKIRLSYVFMLFFFLILDECGWCHCAHVSWVEPLIRVYYHTKSLSRSMLWNELIYSLNM